MRTWGRTRNDDGTINPQWILVETDINGANDEVYLTTLLQCIRLNTNESPFFANYGIPAQQSVIQQVFPDFYIWQLQHQFSPYFASLIITKVQGDTPSYKINVTTNQGVQITMDIPE